MKVLWPVLYVVRKKHAVYEQRFNKPVNRSTANTMLKTVDVRLGDEIQIRTGNYVTGEKILARWFITLI